MSYLSTKDPMPKICLSLVEDQVSHTAPQVSQEEAQLKGNVRQTPFKQS